VPTDVVDEIVSQTLHRNDCSELPAYPAKDEWPEEFYELASATQAMYRYAAANRATLQYMPCFCGCVEGGHTSNFDCYVREVYPDGRIHVDTMSFG
jgi:hypothetical protein